MKIGFIGLGIMGRRMAANLQKAGHELVVYNRTKVKAEALLDAGAQWASSPAEVAGQVPVLFTMLSTPEIVREVAADADGFLDVLAPGSIWVDFTTVNPSFSKEMAGLAKEKGIRFLDAPVAGTRTPAEKGELLVLVGGDADTVAECQPCFDVVGRKTIHVGSNGMGSSLKMIFNYLLAQSMLAFSEAMALGQALGMEREILFDTMLGSAVVAPFVASKRAIIESGDYDAHFLLQWMQKDVQLATMSGYEQQVAMPSGNVAKEIYMQAIQAGLGAEDFSAIFKFYNPE